MTRQVSPERVVGRAKLIEHIWKTLDRGSIIFTAERRIGKTTVMKKMEAESDGSRITIFIDLEKVDSPTRFVEILLDKVHQLLSTKAALGHWIGGFLKSIGGTEVGGLIKLPVLEGQAWQPILEKTIGNVCQQHPDRQLVFLFDELPYMLQKIAARERKSGSVDNPGLSILDSLRAMRHEYSNLRMIFTGSVGLHHVVSELRGTEFASQPTNDMTQVEIGPLAESDAVQLALTLLNEFGVQSDSMDLVAHQIAELTDRIPFYIDKIVSRLGILESRVTVAKVEEEIQWHLSSDKDPWELEHFRERLRIYYGGDLPLGSRTVISFSKVAMTVLDILATSDSPQSIDQVFAALKAKLAIKDRDVVIKLLSFLANDHYLVCNDKKQYSFRFPLIKKWWVLAQGLHE